MSAFIWGEGEGKEPMLAPVASSPSAAYNGPPLAECIDCLSIIRAGGAVGQARKSLYSAV